MNTGAAKRPQFVQAALAGIASRSLKAEAYDPPRTIAPERLANMPTIELTEDESKLLKVVNRDDEATLPKLASGLKFTPSEVRSAVSRLQRFALLAEEDAVFRLTPSGKALVRSLGASRESRNVRSLLSVRRPTPSSRTTPDPADADLDAALDEAIANAS